TRVSGVMTNAPVMLNVDCDMFVNNPDVVLHAMCLLIGFDNVQMSGFVHLLRRDCKDSRAPSTKAQGVSTEGKSYMEKPPIIWKGTEEQNYVEKKESAAEIITSTTQSPKTAAAIKGLTATVAAAKQVASCTYELNTCWGKEVGWAYGTLTEDIQTGLRIHSLGWKSVALDTNPPAFLGSAPVGGPASMTQYKRWCTGLLETLVGRNSPITATLTKDLGFRQCLAYLLINTWSLRSVPELCYALLAPFCVFSNTTFLPMASEPMLVILVLLLVSYNVYTLTEYLVCGLSVRAWWNNQRMERIHWTSASLFGLLCVVMKVLGMSQTTFEVTAKEQNKSTGSDAEEDPGRFTFDSSPLFIPGTVIVLLNLAALVVGSLKVMGSLSGMNYSKGTGIGELVCSAWVVVGFCPFLKGLFGKGRYGIPWPTIAIGSVLSSLFLLICKWTS
ncbi:hypothetical protein Taro_056991, partial [Colocasia esculenta]|nr:hypothetical protein [Colocasia esculenta]